MKKFNLLTIIIFTVILSTISGCSNLKSKPKMISKPKTLVRDEIQASEINNEAKTSGLENLGNFDDSDIQATNRFKAPYDQSYHFELNKYDIKSDDIEFIGIQAKYLVNNHHARVRIEGNADERGSREYNITLGWNRAKAVAEILKQHGVSDTQIILVSYGKEKPIAFGHDEDSYSKNRRSDLFYEIK
ncbi:MAG: OmpA family protein [Coxiellaceae bacterium]|jgi:peptidoglycan-associated lipoprotein|nr:OmpA family protein [Coxiellaceae bacterium]